MKLAVLCPSEIAFRRFMPALKQVPFFEYAGVGVASAKERCVGVEGASVSDQADQIRFQEEFARRFEGLYGACMYGSYEELLADKGIEAVYIPLPPRLHYPWAKRALEQKKHVLIEKPATTSLRDTMNLVQVSRAYETALYENYMFVFHSQIEYFRSAIASGDLGAVRTVRVDFGFPFRGRQDFRYSKKLGGGALLDCGGYTLKLASILLGSSARVVASRLNYIEGFDVDMFGSAVLENNEGLVIQVSFGMDNDYRCSIDVWGSKASLSSGRVLTAPDGFEPTVFVRHNGENNTIRLPADDSFKKSIEFFAQCIQDKSTRISGYDSILQQAQLMQSVMDCNG